MQQNPQDNNIALEYPLQREISKLEVMLHNQSVYYLFLLKNGFYFNENVEKCLDINSKYLSTLYLAYAAYIGDRKTKINYIDSAISINKHCTVPQQIKLNMGTEIIGEFFPEDKKLNLISLNICFTYVISKEFQEETSIILHTRKGKANNLKV